MCNRLQTRQETDADIHLWKLRGYKVKPDSLVTTITTDYDYYKGGNYKAIC